MNPKFEKDSYYDKSLLKYKQNLIKINTEYNDLENMKKIVTILKNQRIKCFKYNASLDDKTCFYAATLRLSEDGKKLIINNKRTINARKYIGTTDPKEVGIATTDYKEALRLV